MKILYITRRIFGLPGTPGTYLAVEGYSKYHDIMVVAQKNDQLINLNQRKKNFELIEIDYNKKWTEKLTTITNKYKPDFVCIASFTNWTLAASTIKSTRKSVPIFLEIKSPPLLEGTQLSQLHKKSHRAQKLIDGIIALNENILRSWLPDPRVRFLLHPLMVDCNKIKSNSSNNINTKFKIIFVGSLSKKRKLKKLMGLIQNLPDRLRSLLVFDFYGDGDVKNELKMIVDKNGLSNCVRIKNFVDQEQLFELYRQYNAGLAWVPSHLYNDAPSLKLTEYLCSGLIPLATSTKGHLRLHSQDIQCLYFNENETISFAKAIEKAIKISKTNDASSFKKNSFLAKRIHHYQNIISASILPFYISIYKECFVSDLYKNSFAKTKKNKVFFVSPRPFGQIATPGTYLSAEAYSTFFDFELICTLNKDNNNIIVHKKRNNFNIIKSEDENSLAKDLIAYINIQQPEIVIFASWAKWFDVVCKVGHRYPSLPLILEIKSPLLANGIKANSIREKCSNAQRYLSCIMSPTKKMAETWFKTTSTDIYEHYSIIDFLNISQKKSISNSASKKFIFVGSLSKKRNISQLLIFISKLDKKILKNSTFDFYGDGPDKNNLERLSYDLSIGKYVTFKGALDQQSLLHLYHEYDCGIAWVPSSFYNTAPSLKLIEYCAAGLIPIATKNYGHTILDSRGFKIEYFDDNSFQSFHHAIQNIHSNSYSQDDLSKNIYLAEHNNYHNVIYQQFIPQYLKYVQPYKNFKYYKAYSQWIYKVLKNKLNNGKKLNHDCVDSVFEDEKFLHAKRINSIF